MGASYFEEIGEGETAEEAFNKLIEKAYWDYGHSGYTGSICEKKKFQMVDIPPLAEKYAHAIAEDLSNEKPYSDKWEGPAGCIVLDDGRFLFFGMASS